MIIHLHTSKFSNCEDKHIDERNPRNVKVWAWDSITALLGKD